MTSWLKVYSSYQSIVWRHGQGISKKGGKEGVMEVTDAFPRSRGSTPIGQWQWLCRDSIPRPTQWGDPPHDRRSLLLVQGLTAWGSETGLMTDQTTAADWERDNHHHLVDWKFPARFTPSPGSSSITSLSSRISSPTVSRAGPLKAKAGYQTLAAHSIS